MAAVFATWELGFRTHQWNKTPHDVQEEGVGAATAEAAVGS